MGAGGFYFALARLHEDMRVFSGHINDGNLALSITGYWLSTLMGPK